MTDIVIYNDFNPIISLVINSVSSIHSKRAYGKAINDFLDWWDIEGRPPLSRATVQQYKSILESDGLSPATINLRLSAIRKLVSEAAYNGMMDRQAAIGITEIKGVKSAGVRAGNWLSKVQAERLLAVPTRPTLKSLRDRAILAVMIGAGLRLSEVAHLTFDHIQQREGRWVIVDLVGKGKRVRSVPIPSWTKAAIDSWADAAVITDGCVFRGVYRFGRTLDPNSHGMTNQAIYNMVVDAGKVAGFNIGPHDLRRTYAKLARKGGAELTQIQLSLGHANVQTTQRYVGEDQNLTDAPCDRLGLDLSGD